MGVKLAEAEAEKLCVTMSAVGANPLDDTPGLHSTKGDGRDT